MLSSLKYPCQKDYEGKHGELDAIQTLCIGCVIQRCQTMADKEKDNDNDEVTIDENSVIGSDNNDNEFDDELNNTLACDKINE